MKKGTKMPVKYDGKVIGEAEVMDRDNGVISVEISDPEFEKLIGGPKIEGVAYRPTGNPLVGFTLEAIPRCKKEN